MKKFYRRILSLGLPPNAQFKEKLKIELSNQFIILGLASVIIHNIVNLFVLHSFIDFCLTLVWSAVLVPALLLNIYNRPVLARNYLSLGGITAVFILHILFGAEFKLEAMYILYLVVGTLFFDSSAMVRFSVLVLVLYISASIITTFYEPMFVDFVKPSGVYTRFIFSVAMISAMIGKLVLENRRYNTLIGEQNEHLNTYNKQLKTFNYIVSHDLKEPLRGIVSFSQLLKRRAKQEDEIDKGYLDHIINSTKQLNKLIADLNDFTTLEEIELSKEVVNIGEIVREIEFSIKEDKPQEKIALSCTEFPDILSSKIALTIILRNLIENGIKYNDKEIREIVVEGEIRDGRAIISVKDNGIGIEEKYHEHAFEMFKHLNANYEKGSGLGLSISQILAKRLKGELFISNSRIGKGSSFQLSFPVALN